MHQSEYSEEFLWGTMYGNFYYTRMEMLNPKHLSLLRFLETNKNVKGNGEKSQKVTKEANKY